MMPLAMAGVGVDLTLRAVQGGQQFRQRLADLGLTPGSVVRLVQREGEGPLIIALRNDARLALGRGMALKIMVEDAG